MCFIVSALLRHSPIYIARIALPAHVLAPDHSLFDSLFVVILIIVCVHHCVLYFCSCVCAPCFYAVSCFRFAAVNAKATTGVHACSVTPLHWCIASQSIASLIPIIAIDFDFATRHPHSISLVHIVCLHTPLSYSRPLVSCVIVCVSVSPVTRICSYLRMHVCDTLASLQSLAWLHWSRVLRLSRSLIPSDCHFHGLVTVGHDFLKSLCFIDRWSRNLMGADLTLIYDDGKQFRRDLPRSICCTTH